MLLRVALHGMTCPLLLRTAATCHFNPNHLLICWPHHSWKTKKMCARCHVQLFVTSWTVIHQAPLSMEFSKQEDWSGLPFPPPRDLPNPGTDPTSPALAGRFLTDESHCIYQSSCPSWWVGILSIAHAQAVPCHSSDPHPCVTGQVQVLMSLGCPIPLWQPILLICSVVWCKIQGSMKDLLD